MAEKRPIKYANIHGNDYHWTGVDRISFVDQPAIEVDYVALSKVTDESIRASRIAEANAVKCVSTPGLKGYVTGPALIPEKPMLRYTKHDGYFDLIFTAEVIKTTAIRYAARGNQNNANAQHEYPVEMTTFFESWIIEDAECDKAKAMGFDLPVGTWMVTARVTDPDLLKDIEDGVFKGFSIEGFYTFDDEPLAVEAAKEKQPSKQTDLAKLMSDKKAQDSFFTRLRKSLRASVGLNVHLAAYVLSDGNSIDVDEETKEAKVVDSEGNLGEAAADGIYSVADSSDLLVIYGGKWVRTTTSNAAAAVEMALQTLVADGGDRAAIETTILESTGLTAEEWASWMDGSYGCVDKTKIESIATAIGIEGSALIAEAEKDGCEFEAMTAEETQAAMQKIATILMRKTNGPLDQKDLLRLGKVKESADGKVEAGAMQLEDGDLIYIASYNGGAWTVNLDDLYPEDYLAPGTYTTRDGKKLVIKEVVESYEGWDGETYTYTWSQLDFEASDIDAGDLIPWVKEQMEANQAQVTAAQLALSTESSEHTATKTQLATLTDTNKAQAAEIARLTALNAKLGALPAADPLKAGKELEEKSAYEVSLEAHLKKVTHLRAKH